MFIYLQQSSVTSKTIKIITSSQLVTHNTLLPHLKLRHFNMAEEGPFPFTAYSPPAPYLHFQVSGPGLSQAVKWSQVGLNLPWSLKQASLSTTELSFWIYVWSSCYPRNGHTERLHLGLRSIVSTVGLLIQQENSSKMWVELYKNTMSHLILLIVAIRLARTQPLCSQQKAKWKKWQAAICPQKWGVRKCSLECLRYHVVWSSIWSPFSRSHKKRNQTLVTWHAVI